jgi:hypothetical protein
VGQLTMRPFVRIALALETPTGVSVAVSKDTQFIDNTTRVGSGVVPLPQVLTPGR